MPTIYNWMTPQTVEQPRYDSLIGRAGWFAVPTPRPNDRDNDDNPFAEVRGQSGVYLPQPNCMRRFRAALGRSATGGPPAKLVCKGDSTTYGVIGSGGNGSSAIYNPSNLVSPVDISWADRMRRLLTSSNNLGGRVDEGAFWKATSDNDSRMSVGGTWATGGGVWSATPSTTGLLTFTDANTSVDSYDIWIMKTSGTAVTVSVQIDSESAISVDLSGQAVNTALIAKRVTAVAGVGVHVVKISAPVGGNISVYGFEPINTVSPPVMRVSRHGVSGQRLDTFMSSGSTGTGGQFWYSHTNYKPDAAMLLMGINDLHSSTELTLNVAAAVYKIALTSYVTMCQALNMDVILMVFPTRNYAAAQLTPSDYEGVLFHQVIYEVAKAYNCAVIDVQRMWGYGSGPTTPTGTPTPTPLYDGVHPTLAGYRDLARLSARFISNNV